MLVITQQEAKMRGLTRYFTGEPCKHGHSVERLVSNRSCISCGNRRCAAWARSKSETLAARARSRRAYDPQSVRKIERDRYQADPRVKMLSAAKQRAKLKGIAFDIAIGDIEIPATCPLLGIPMVIGAGIIQDGSPTLDRIRNSAGYVRGNVAVISHAANRCKGTLASSDLFRLAEKLQDLEWLAKEKGFI